MQKKNNKKYLMLILIVTLSFQNTHTIFLKLLSDFFLIGEVLDEVNKQNREALYQGVKNLLNNSQEEINKYYKEPINSEIIPDLNDTFTFKDVAGKIPEDISEIVEFLKDSERFTRVGAKMPKGILLVGPPGTGKTSIVRAIAGEANAEFFYAAASDFIQIYVGTGPQKIRKLFDQAKKATSKGYNKKAIIFIDELDAIGGSRGAEQNSEYRNTLNALLEQMDGFNQNPDILILGATNTPATLDPALKRPGRFDRIVEIGLPDEQSRLEIIELYAKALPKIEDIDFIPFAQATRGYSGADLKNLVNEASIRAAREEAEIVTHKHFQTALADIQTKKRKNR